jgi:pimeloyl-ACP methyl ester carboxylesterase
LIAASRFTFLIDPYVLDDPHSPDGRFTVGHQTARAHHRLGLQQPRDNPDARTVEYSQAGHGRRTVLYFHGSPGIGQLGIGLLPGTEQLAVLGTTRSGYGFSQHFPGRTAADSARDAFQLLEYTGRLEHTDTDNFGKVVVLARSGGTAHALAFAALFPEYIEQIILLVPSVPPQFTRPEDSMAHVVEALRNANSFSDDAKRIAIELETDPNALNKHLQGELRRKLRMIGRNCRSHPDYSQITFSFVSRVSSDVHRAALIGTEGRGWIDDSETWGRLRLGFSLDDVPREYGGQAIPMTMIGATEDIFTPLRGIRNFARTCFPHARVLEVEGVGHFNFTTTTAPLLKVLSSTPACTADENPLAEELIERRVAREAWTSDPVRFGSRNRIVGFSRALTGRSLSQLNTREREHVDTYSVGFGDTVVMYFHDSPDIGDPGPFSVATQRATTVIGATRRGYGGSTPTALERTARTTEDAIDLWSQHRSRAKRMIVVSVGDGSPYALAFLAAARSTGMPVDECVFIAPRVPPSYARDAIDPFASEVEIEQLSKRLALSPKAIIEHLIDTIRSAKHIVGNRHFQADVALLTLSGLSTELAERHRQALVGTHGRGWIADRRTWVIDDLDVGFGPAYDVTDVPMTVVYGEHDPFLAASSVTNFFGAIHPNARLAALPQAGHFGTLATFNKIVAAVGLHGIATSANPTKHWSDGLFPANRPVLALTQTGRPF